MTISIYRQRALLASLGLLLTVAMGASAQIIGISNLGETKTTDTIVDSNQSLGVMFTTGSEAWELTSVDLYASDFSTSPDGPFSVALYSVSGSLPDQKIVDLTGSDPVSYSNYNYVPVSTTMLQPSTSYYIVASSTSSSGFYVWGSTSSTAFTGQTGWTFFVGNAVTSGGSSWGLNSGTDTPEIAVNVAAVPEPSSLALFALAFTGLVAYRHRVTRRTATQQGE